MPQICCEEGKGSYRLIVDGKSIRSGGDFKDKEETYFIIGKKGTFPPKCNKKKKKYDTLKCVGNDKKKKKN